MHAIARSLHHRSAHLLLLAASPFVTSVPELTAQDSHPPRKDESSAQLLEEIPSVFGASRFDQLATEAPASVTVITAEDIASHGWRTLVEALQMVRGLQLTNDGVYPSIGARGFSPPGDYNSRMLLVVDGHRMNESLFDSFGVGLDGVLDLADVERIEVIRGPASSLYGTSAFFGVVNVVTTRGRTLGGMRATVLAESYRTRALRLAAGNRLPGGLEGYVSAQLQRSDGRDYFFQEFDTGATGGHARRLDGERYEHATVRLGWREVALTAMLGRRTKDFATGRYNVDFGVPGNDVVDGTRFVGLSTTHAWSPRSTTLLQASFNAYDYGGRFKYAGTPASDWARGRWGIVETQYAGTSARGDRIVLGAQGIVNFRQGQGLREDGALTFVDDSRQTIMALYGQGEFRVGAGWLANGGLRLDHHTSFGATLNPRLALIRTFGAGSALKLLYGSAFRAANNFERLYEGLNLVPNPSLRPERIRTFEALLERRLGARAKLSASVFRNAVFDLVEDNPTDVANVQQFRNSGRARAAGVELEGEIDLRRVRARATYVLQRGRDVNAGVDLPNAPRHLATLDLVAPLAERGSFALEVRHLASRDASSGVRVDGYVVANSWLSLRLPLPGLRLGVGVNNLFDARYADPTGSDFVQSAIPQSARSFRLALDVGGR